LSDLVIGLPRGLDTEALVQQITSAVDPTSWDSGPEAARRIQPMGKKLYVNQTDVNQREIERLLYHLRLERKSAAFWKKAGEFVVSIILGVLVLHGLFRVYRARFRPRIAFTSIAILSLCACIGVGVLWVRSYRIGDLWHLRTEKNWYFLTGAHGALNFGGWPRAEHDSKTLKAPVNYQVVIPGQNRRGKEASWQAARVKGKIAFVRYWAGNWGSRTRQSTWQVSVPYALIASLFGIPAILWVTALVRGRSHKQDGFCTACGYDLRATPARCPECGKVVKQAVETDAGGAGVQEVAVASDR
jgi:hypothetical protein